MGAPIMPIAVGTLFAGAILSGVIAAVSANDKRAGDLQRSVIALAVFSTLCMLVTSVYWIPALFSGPRAASAAGDAAAAYVPPLPEVSMPPPQVNMASFPDYGGAPQMHLHR